MNLTADDSTSKYSTGMAQSLSRRIISWCRRPLGDIADLNHYMVHEMLKAVDRRTMKSSSGCYSRRHKGGETGPWEAAVCQCKDNRPVHGMLDSDGIKAR